nr:class I SAM-dependent methyltransferase [Nakamurella panacisegetis]
MFGVLRLPTSGTNLLEIGCGPGRMTGRLAELYDAVTAVDISPQMIARAEFVHRDSHSNISFRTVTGNGDLPFAGESFDGVFSYITLQHIPDPRHQLRYIEESLRVVRRSGWCAIQVRSPSKRSIAHEWVGHIGHTLQRKRTLSPAWRGAKIDLASVESLCRRVGADLSVNHLTLRHDWLLISRN